MAAGPQRRTTPVPHLMAHIVPVERALLERARVLDERADELAAEKEQPKALVATVLALTAEEFRALATELHHW